MGDEAWGEEASEQKEEGEIASNNEGTGENNGDPATTDATGEQNADRSPVVDEESSPLEEVLGENPVPSSD